MKRRLSQIPIEEIRELYIDKQMTQKEIAQFYHIDVKKLREKMRRGNIPLRSGSEVKTLFYEQVPEKYPNYVMPSGAAPKRPPKEVLYDYYINQGRSIKEIGSIIGLHHLTVSTALKEYDIPIRERTIRPLRPGEWEKGFLSAYRIYQRAAAARGYSFELTEEQFHDLIMGNCYYCGNPPILRKFLNITRNGVDRKDNTQGYTVTNSCSCCSFCNIQKGSLSEQEFIAWILRAANHLQNRESEVVL